jgi:hypothetical protein
MIRASTSSRQASFFGRFAEKSLFLRSGNKRWSHSSTLINKEPAAFQKRGTQRISRWLYGCSGLLAQRDQPLPPAQRGKLRKGHDFFMFAEIARPSLGAGGTDESTWAALCAVCESDLSAQRYALGRAHSLVPDSRGELLAGLSALHRIESSACRHCGASGRIRLNPAGDRDIVFAIIYTVGISLPSLAAGNWLRYTALPAFRGLQAIEYLPKWMGSPSVSMRCPFEPERSNRGCDVFPCSKKFNPGGDRSASKSGGTESATRRRAPPAIRPSAGRATRPIRSCRGCPSH